VPYIRTVRSNVSTNNADGKSVLQGGGIGTEPTLQGVDQVKTWASFEEAEAFQDTFTQFMVDGQWKSYKDYFDIINDVGYVPQVKDGDAMSSAANDIFANTSNTNSRNASVTSNEDTTEGDEFNVTTPADLFGGITPDNDYTESEIDQVFNLIASGAASSEEVAEYFNLPVDIVNAQIAARNNATTDTTPASFDGTTGGSIFSGIEPDGDYTEDERNFILEALYDNTVTSEEAAEYFDLTVAEIDAARQAIIDDDPYFNGAFSTGTNGLPSADGDYTQADLDTIVDMVNNGIITVAQVADFYDFTEKDVQDVLDEQNRTHHNSGVGDSDVGASDVGASDAGASDAGGSDISGLDLPEADGDYNEADYSKIVDLIKRGLITVAQVAGFYDFTTTQVQDKVDEADAANASAIEASAIEASAIDGSTIDGSDIDGSAIDGSAIDGSAIDGSAIDGSDVDGSDLDGSDLDGSTIDGSTIDGSTIDGSTIDGSTIDGSTIDGSTIDGSTIDGSTIDGSTIDGSTIDGSTIDGSTIDGSTIDGSGLDGSSVGSGLDGSSVGSGLDGSSVGSGLDGSSVSISFVDGTTIGTAGIGGGSVSGFSSLFSNTSKTTESGDPDWKKRALNLWGEETGINDDLQSRLNTSFTDYTGDRYRDLNADQIDARNKIRGNIEDIPGQALFDKSVAAANATRTTRVDPVTGRVIGQEAFGGSGDQSLFSAGRGNIQDLVAGQFAGTNLDPYMNPYTDRVINRGLSDLDKATQERLNEADAQATMGGAYGGDRASLERGVIGGESIRAAEKMISDLRYRGYNEAADMLMKDMDREMDASGANQLADANVTRDSMNIAADLARGNQDSAQRAKEQDNLNQQRQSQALLDAFGQGTDAYRGYLGDYVGMGEDDYDRSQLDNDFDYKQFMDAYGYDQEMIQNMINLFGVSPRDKTTEEETKMGAAGQLAALGGAWPGIEAGGKAAWGAGNAVYDWLKGLGDDDDKLFG
jgi:uncharacterized protein YjbI with pentapeptide repeats